MNSGLYSLLIAFSLGLLVGIQREFSEKLLAGVRTFPLISLFGALSALLAQELGGIIVAAGFIALTAIIILGNIARIKKGDVHFGVTTEVAALLMFAVGAMVAAGFTTIGVVVGGGVAVLLHWKTPLHQFIRNLDEGDIRAVARLVLIALVILPILPDKAYDSYGVLNPFKIWLIVVLIVGISMAAYVANQILGSKVGIVLTGILGGIISSTATTVSYARRTREQQGMDSVVMVVVMIASTVVFGRVLFELAVVTPGALVKVAPPLLAMAGYMTLIAVGAFMISGKKAGKLHEQKPPSNLKVAIIFGLLYGAVLYGVAVTKAYLGNAGLYAVAALSGLTEMDAITLSTGHMMESGKIEADTGWRLILVGAMSNILFKLGAAGVFGSTGLLMRLTVVFTLSIAGGAALLAFWP